MLNSIRKFLHEWKHDFDTFDKGLTVFVILFLLVIIFALIDLTHGWILAVAIPIWVIIKAIDIAASFSEAFKKEE